MGGRGGADIREAVGLHQAGKLAEAETSYRAILLNCPDDADVNHFLGVVLYQMSRGNEAWEYIKRTLELRPGDPRSLLSAGDVLAGLGQWDDAREHFQQVLALQPNHAATWHRLGIVYRNLKRSDDAIDAYRRAIAIKPDFVEALTDLGVPLHERGDLAEAERCYQQALALQPGFVNAVNNLGVVLREMGEPFRAARQFETALQLQPDDATILINLAGALSDSGEADRAIATAQAALRIAPDWEEAHFNVGWSELLRGNYPAGWAGCEPRWEARENRRDYAGCSRWDGSDLSGRTILLHAEDGFGDAIQFIRYAPMVAARGGRVLLRCQPALRRLFAQINSIESIIENVQPAPPCDVHSSLMSLPRIFVTTVDSIPGKMPYLSADPAIAETWRRRLLPDGAQLKIGLAWAGSPEFREDRLRSPHLAALSDLSQADGVRFYSLQKGYAADEAKTPPAGMDLVDWTDELNDFADTAALITNLDLVISSDTAVVHLAGAMGKPVWVLLPFTPGCFWLSKRPDSPWYPTMRLFRQKHPKSWAEPVNEIVAALAQFSNSSPG